VEKLYMKFFDLVLSDYRANQNNWKGLLLLILYRLAHTVTYCPKAILPFGYIYLCFYKLFTELIVGTEIHWRCKIGPGASLYHGYGLVIHSGAVIGSGAVLRHGVTIGVKSKHASAAAPILGNNVDIGASAIIIGSVKVGDGAVVGAGSVITKDIPPNSVVVGNPARVVRILRNYPL
jgi:serine acetyltransferase